MSDSKQSLLRTLRECAMLMEIVGENPFRCRAYEEGARALEALEGGPREWVESGILAETKGIGKGLAEKVDEWARSGHIVAIDELRQKVPAGLLELISIPGLGPKKIRVLWKELGIETLGQLEEAIKAGRVQELAGFGEKTAEKILAGIEQRKHYETRVTLEVATGAAELVLERLRQCPAIGKLELAGSYRRSRETVKDLDVIATSPDPEAVMKVFVTTPGVQRIIAHGPTKSSILLEGGIPVDLRVVEDSQFAAALNYFTGSKEHNTALRGRAKKMGLKLNEYGLFPEESETPFKTADEEAIYKRLGLAYVEPEMRENNGEIEAAEEGKLPKLITREDLRGIVHCHTTYSDGKNTPLEMAKAARDLGFEYIVICDHSQSAFYAGGMKPDTIKAQMDEIDEIGKKLKPFKLFYGVESDILADGALDYDDEILGRLDIVVGAIHTRLTMAGDEMTARVCRALENPAITILAHPTGRLLQRREPFNADMDKIIATAGAHDVVMEINSHPWRLDLDWRLIRQAHAAGCKFSIDPDSHNTLGLRDVRYGVGIARKGWLTAGDVINTKTAKQFAEWVAKRKKSRLGK
ncbi:DNA polymerase/3'-5' exonuclease PolX [bacterium]|nr:DNA polymerase/3'-5' exonuclease PolX [bacterium]